MKQMAFRGVDPVLEQRLRAEARRNGTSLNRAVIDLLKKALGIAKPAAGMGKPVEFHDLDHLIGKWNKKEAKSFDRTLADQRQIDDDLWR